MSLQDNILISHNQKHMSLTSAFFVPKKMVSLNHISGVMVCVLAQSVVAHVFEFRSGQTKECKIGICCFSANHASLRRKSRDWLSQNHVFD